MYPADYLKFKCRRGHESTTCSTNRAKPPRFFRVGDFLSLPSERSCTSSRPVKLVISLAARSRIKIDRQPRRDRCARCATQLELFIGNASKLHKVYTRRILRGRREKKKKEKSKINFRFLLLAKRKGLSHVYLYKVRKSIRKKQAHLTGQFIEAAVYLVIISS